MIRVMIVEDEQPILDLMERLVRQHPQLVMVGAFTSPAEALVQFDVIKPDAVFLDIEMPRMGGMELAERLIAIDEELPIVFTTAYPDYAVDAFRIRAVDYLLKPVLPDDIERVYARLAKHQALRSRRPAQEDPVVRCLGTFETRGANGNVMSWPTRKTEELFAYFLIYPNRYVSKWQLADLLWPDLSEERAAHNVHHTIHRLKKALKDAGISVELISMNEGYHLRIAAEFSDIESLRHFMQRTTAFDNCNVGEGESYFKKYRGQLFGGKDYVWSTGAAAELALQYTGLTRMLIAYYRARKDNAALKDILRAYLMQAQLDEEMNAVLLRLYLELGEKGPFLRHYEQYARKLEEEFGIAPSAEIQSLYVAISSS